MATQNLESSLALTFSSKSFLRGFTKNQKKITTVLNPTIVISTKVFARPFI